MTTKSTRAACGIRAVASSLGTQEAVAAARAELTGAILQHIIVFFSTDHDPDVLLDALKKNFPETTYRAAARPAKSVRSASCKAASSSSRSPSPAFA